MSTAESEPDSPVDATAFALAMLLGRLDRYVETQTADLEMARVVGVQAVALDDLETRVVELALRADPERDPDLLRAAVREPLRRLRGEFGTASADATADALDGILALVKDLASDVSIQPLLLDIIRTATRPSATARILASLLVTAVAEFEAKAGEIAEIFAAVPPHQEIGDDRFEERAEAMGQRLARKPASTRFAIIVDEFAVGSPLSSECLEVLARRNAIVHSGGRADKVYVASTGRERGDQEQTEAILDVSPGYFQDASDEMLIAMAAVVLDGIDAYETPGRSAIVAALGGAAYRLLLADRNKAAAFICQRYVDDTSLEPRTSAMMRVNYWLALTRLGRGDEVIEQIREWDPSPLEDMFSLAKSVLLGDLDEGAELAEQIVASGATTRGALLAQPIFAPLLERASENS